MRTAVIINSYNWPWALERSLWGFASQTRRDFRIIIADDGSGRETRELLARMRAEAGLDILHVWHEHRGFRKSEILNRAIAAAEEEYLIFTDHDVIPREDFVAQHLRYARPGHYLAGMAVRLPKDVSARITVEDARLGRATDLGWLRAQGYRPGKYALRLSRSEAWNTFFDWGTTSPPRWRGCNSSTFRDYLIAVNGLDMGMGYGGQDAELGERLVHSGIRPRRVRFRTPAVHLWHDRPYRDEAVVLANRQYRQQVRTSRLARTPRGITEMEPMAQPGRETEPQTS